MSKALINDNKLIDKNYSSVFLSKVIREFFLQIIPSLGATAFLLFRYFNKVTTDRDELVGLVVICYALFLIVFILITNQFVMNSLARVNYKRFSLKFVKDGQLLEKLNYSDALRLKLSFCWRRLCFYALAVLIFFGLEFVLSPETLHSLERGLNTGLTIAGAMITVYWTLRTKKTGCYIYLQAKS